MSVQRISNNTPSWNSYSCFIPETYPAPAFRWSLPGRRKIVLRRCLRNNLGSSREEFLFVFQFERLHNLFSNLYFMQNSPQAVTCSRLKDAKKRERNETFWFGVILYNRCVAESLIRSHLNFRLRWLLFSGGVSQLCLEVSREFRWEIILGNVSAFLFIACCSVYEILFEI